jgi:hypothetical protein
MRFMIERRFYTARQLGIRNLVVPLASPNIQTFNGTGIFGGMKRRRLTSNLAPVPLPSTEHAYKQNLFISKIFRLIPSFTYKEDFST